MQEALHLDILHSQAAMSFEWLERGSERHPMIDNRVQPVFINNRSIYLQGKRLWSQRGDTSCIWKYSIPDKSWLLVEPPQGIEISWNNYTLVAYRSHLVMIGGRRNQQDNKKIFKLDDGSWVTETALPDSAPHDCINNMSASSEGKYLVIAWIVNHESLKLLIFDGQNWRMQEGPSRFKREVCIPAILVKSEMLYLVDYQHSLVYQASLKNSRELQWESINCYLHGGNLISNITIFGDNIAMVTDFSPDKARVLAFLPTYKSCTVLRELTFDTHNLPNIVSVADGKLLLMGVKEYSSLLQYDMMIRNPQLGILQLTN